MKSQDISYQIVINAYLREVESSWQKYPTGAERNPKLWATSNETVIITLPQQGFEIAIGVQYWSLTLRHQFIFPVYCRSLCNHKNLEIKWQPLAYCHFISLVMREEGLDNPRGKGDLNGLVLRCLLSQQNTQSFIDFRGEAVASANQGALSFIESEQSLLVGHPLHPIAKSRQGFSSTELMQYSPESACSFQLHYFIADLDLIHQDSALTLSAVDIVKSQLKKSRILAPHNQSALLTALDDKDKGIIPVHPWQASYLLTQPDIKLLVDQGRLNYLGAQGDFYTATTSVRTVFNATADFMYKFSLNMRITNSERVNKHWELDRVIETARLMQMPIADRIKASVPHFEIVQEPAFISLKINGKVIDGFSCILRDATPFKDQNQDITSITALVQDSPLERVNNQQGRLFHLIKNIAQQEKNSIEAVSLTWFERYLDVAIESLMILFTDWGLCFEPHGQNTLLALIEGYPNKCFCRDGQGFFHRQAAHDDWCKIMPAKGEATDSIFPEALAKERLIYYPFINQAFSVINAFGTQQLIDEATLMTSLRTKMDTLAKKTSRYPFTLHQTLTESERLPCKGNLLTQLYDMDELVGDIATQSVYVSIPNVYLADSE